MTHNECQEKSYSQEKSVAYQRGTCYHFWITVWKMKDVPSVDKKSLIILLLAVLVPLGILQFSYGALQQDDYYHIRYAEMMRIDGPAHHFPWLKHTVLNETYNDNHFLFHCLLAPFSFGNLIVGGKAAALLFFALLALVFYWFLHKNDVPYPLFWSLLFVFASHATMTRYLAVRPMALSIIFYLLAIHFLLHGRWILLGLISALFTLMYSAYPVLVVIAAFYCFMDWLLRGRFDYKLLAAVAAGIGVGLVVNPHFPNNLRIMAIQYSSGGLVRPEMEPNAEWSPVTTWTMVRASWPVFAALATVIFLSLRRTAEHTFLTLYLFLLMLIFFAGHLKMARGVDQFVPFAVLFCASAFGALRIRLSPWTKVSAVIALCFVVAFNMNHVLLGFRSIEKIDNRGAALWLKENTPAGSEVFLANYGAFPQLFFYNRHNVYTLGLDPNYMARHDSRLYQMYEDAIHLKTDPYPAIKDAFRARYVHVENIPRTLAFAHHLLGHPERFRLVYKDGFSALFEVL